MSEPTEPTNSAREAYLRNQQAVATKSKSSHRWTAFNYLTLALGVVTIALYVGTVISYYNNPQQDGPTDDTLPTLTSIAFMATAYSVVLPYLIESRTLGKRIRNLVLAAIPAVILTIFGVAIFISLGSLVADLAYNLSH